MTFLILAALIIGIILLIFWALFSSDEPEEKDDIPIPMSGPKASKMRGLERLNSLFGKRRKRNKKGDPSKRKTVCPNCGYKNNVEDRCCRVCGERLAPSEEFVFCPSCNQEYSSLLRFCPNCGRLL